MSRTPERCVEEPTMSAVTLLLAAPLMGAAAGAMGWGIRGQYGHEWGAMVPGVLVASGARDRPPVAAAAR